jgi:hypothetical protein
VVLLPGIRIGGLLGQSFRRKTTNLSRRVGRERTVLLVQSIPFADRFPASVDNVISQHQCISMRELFGLKKYNFTPSLTPGRSEFCLELSRSFDPLLNASSSPSSTIDPFSPTTPFFFENGISMVKCLTYGLSILCSSSSLIGSGAHYPLSLPFPGRSTGCP